MGKTLNDSATIKRILVVERCYVSLSEDNGIERGRTFNRLILRGVRRILAEKQPDNDSFDGQYKKGEAHVGN